MNKVTTKQEDKLREEFEKLLESRYIHRINDSYWDLDGLNMVDTVEAIWQFIEKALQVERYTGFLRGLDRSDKDNWFGDWKGVHSHSIDGENYIGDGDCFTCERCIKEFGLKKEKTKQITHE